VGEWYCIDAACHHLGGPLVEGDIEELGGGALCIRCPWHGRRVDLDSGRAVERVSDAWSLSDAPVQRTHAVVLEHGYVFVHVATAAAGPCASDKFCVSPVAASPAIAPSPAARPSPQAYLIPYAGSARLPPPPPPLCAFDMQSPGARSGLGFRAERLRTATAAVLAKPISPRVLFPQAQMGEAMETDG